MTASQSESQVARRLGPAASFVPDAAVARAGLIFVASRSPTAPVGPRAAGEQTGEKEGPLSGATEPALTSKVREAFAEPEQRVEGPLKVSGRARYTADLNLPGTLQASFVTSPFPHARIVAIDTSRAKALPGVRAVLTGAEVGPLRFGRRLFDWPVLAYERALFVGDRVAAVAAETREQAEEAAQLIEVEYEELPAALTPEQALAPDAPLLHDPREAAGYVYLGGVRAPLPHPNLQGYVARRTGTDQAIEAAFASAHRVFEHTFTTPRQHQGHIEPHAAVVWIEADGIVQVVSTNKAPFRLRQQLAHVAGLPAEQVVVDNAFIGGDFGGKGLSIDEFACYFLARATGRPIKAVMTYVDELQGATPRHAATLRLRSGVDEQGRFVAHRSEVVFDGGAYAAGKPSPLLVPPGGLATLSPYRVPNALLEVKVVYTNTVPGGHMRAPGEVQAVFAGESHVDMIASAMDIDPLEFRLRNAVREGDIGAAGDRFREPRAVEILEALRRETGWFEAHQALPASRGRGISLSVRHVGGGKTSVTCRLLPDGRVEVVSGVPDQGSGSYTVMQRVAAAVLSVAPEDVLVRHGTTAVAPDDPGAGGSRVTHIVGQAASHGATVLKERLEELASEVMGWPAGQVRLADGHFTVEDGCGEAMPFRELAARIAQSGTVEVEGCYDGEHGADEPSDFNFAAYAIEVEVDRDTGQVRVLDAVLAADVGTVINPVAHQGQLDGGFVYGLGNGIMEELPLEGGKVATVSLGEYKLPVAMDVPRFRTVLVPTTVGPGPFGAKMAGEVSNSGVSPAIANAVAAAVGARVTAMPVTAQRVFEALRGRGRERE